MNLHLSNVDWQQLPNRREKVIFALAMVIFMFVFIKSCWGPSGDAISLLKKEIKESGGERNSVEAVIKNKDGKPGAGSVWQGTMKQRLYYTELAKKMADDPDLIMMNEFSNPALARDVKITKIDMPDQKVESGVTKQAWTVYIRCSFISVGEYLSRLESLPMLLIIDNMDVQTTGDAFGGVKAEVKGEVYGWK